MYTNRSVKMPAGRAATNQAVQPNSDFTVPDNRFHPIKQNSPPVRNMKDNWLKPTNAARVNAAEPFDRCSNPLAFEIAWPMGIPITVRALPVGNSGVVNKPEEEVSAVTGNGYPLEYIPPHTGKQARLID